jgi:hypothetical protein
MVAVPRPNKKAEKIIDKILGVPAARKKRKKVDPIFEIHYPAIGNRPIYSK